MPDLQCAACGKRGSKRAIVGGLCMDRRACRRRQDTARNRLKRWAAARRKRAAS